MTSPNHEPNDRTSISSALKQVDVLVTDGALHAALDLIRDVRRRAPRNIYARAYEERVEELLAAVPLSVSPQEPPREQPGGQPLPPVQPPAVPPTDLISQAYRRFLIAVWKDGITDPAIMRSIDEMRTMFHVDPEQHAGAEREIRLHAFRDAYIRYVVRGGVSEERCREMFRISDAEYLSLSMDLVHLRVISSTIATIVVIDDDTNFLRWSKRLLERAAYRVEVFHAGIAAWEWCRNETPDLVLCDIDLGTGGPSGVEIYSRFIDDPVLVRVPFLFITGSDQAALLVAAQRAGADDFLTKPIENEMLLATIAGKLRRFGEIRDADRKRETGVFG